VDIACRPRTYLADDRLSLTGPAQTWIFPVDDAAKWHAASPGFATDSFA